MSEWQIERNKWGGERRFRIDANGHKEYEMTIDGIPESEYALQKARDKTAILENIKRCNKEQEKFVVCPFRMLRECASLKCDPECALHTASGCGIVSDAPMTGGTICPLANGYRCTEVCAFYGADGCNLRNFMGGTKK